MYININILKPHYIKEGAHKKEVKINVENITYIKKVKIGLIDGIEISFGAHAGFVLTDELTLEDIQVMTNNYFKILGDKGLYNEGKVCLIDEYGVILIDDHLDI